MLGYFLIPLCVDHERAIIASDLEAGLWCTLFNLVGWNALEDPREGRGLNGLNFPELETLTLNSTLTLNP